MKIVKLNYLSVLSFLMLFIACTKPVDFNQLDDLLLEPVVESSIFFFNAEASEFFTGGTEQSEVSDFVQIDIFNNSFINNNLIKLEFVLDIENSINRAYELQLDFLDTNGDLLETFTISADASPNNSVIANTHTEVFEDEALVRIKQSSILNFTLRMLPGEPITTDTPGEIEVHSIGVFHLNIGG
ncbi:hypothetical protein ACKGJY_13745 [Hyunsoonleella sp. 2307UL5-6]|uniref:hypothetical protein n=1 Tax=Hyunsoonleella sp. 2307UL5-6 TaxID=3384768 RepID=UPI0039BD2105